MSGSVKGLLKKAVTGVGQGSYSVTNKKNIDQDFKFLEAMYEKKDENIAKRKKNAQKMVDSFYNLVTDLYESGWGKSFHFAPRGKNETFHESILRHEYYIALKLNIKPNDVVLDIGCGIGEPMRNIAKFTGANIIGVTLNEYQVNRGNELNRSDGLEEQCIIQQGDFCKLEKFKDNTFDKIFAIDSTCHAPDRIVVYKQVFRVLKPNGLFASYEWVLNSDKFNKENKKHIELKYQLEKGNSLPDLITDKQVINDFKKTGFNIIEYKDIDQYSRDKGQLPWYTSFESKYHSLETISHSYCFLGFMSCFMRCLEKIGIAPKGTYVAHKMLQTAKTSLCEGGQTQIFTPMLLVIAKKPNK